MAIRDEDGATRVGEADDVIGRRPRQRLRAERLAVSVQPDARAEQERARADAAEAHAEELRQAEMAARSRAGSLKSQLDKSRNKLNAAIEETKEVRRAAKDALFFQAEVVRLEKLLSEAGVESGRRGTIVSLRKDVARLRKALASKPGRMPAAQSRDVGCARRWSGRRPGRTRSRSRNSLGGAVEQGIARLGNGR